MDPERRKRLEQRRRALQQRIQRQERRDLLSFELDALNRLGISYELVFETEALWDWLNLHFPTTSVSIDWAGVPDHRCWPGGESVPAALVAEVCTEQVGLDDRVEVLYMSRAPALRMRLMDVLAHSKALTGWSNEVWVLCRSRSWIVEFISAESWCWGRAM